MKIMLLGSDGQLGKSLKNFITNHDIFCVNRQICDLKKFNNVKKIIKSYHPDIIINASGYTDVNNAEIDQSLAFIINNESPEFLAKISNDINIPFIHFSTDFIFDGEKKLPYKEDDIANPINVYGNSKLEGERSIKKNTNNYYIFRLSWLYSNDSNNFYNKIKNKSFSNNTIKVVDDEIGTPTSTEFVAQNFVKILPQINRENVGTYHLVPEGSCSRYEFSELIIKKTNLSFNIENLKRITSDEVESSVRRPKYSVLENRKVKNTFMLKFHNWKTVFLTFLKNNES